MGSSRRPSERERLAPWAARALAVLLAGCGGGDSTAPVTVAVTPATVSLSLTSPAGDGPGVTFSARVTGTSNTAVTWSVTSNGQPFAGAISSSGVLSPISGCIFNGAPGFSVLGATLNIKAVSVANPMSIGTSVAVVDIRPPNPATLVMPTGTAAEFQLGDACAYNSALFTRGFSVAVQGGADNGAIGVPSNSVYGPVAWTYSAPATAGTYTMQVTIGAAKSVATVTVQQPLPSTGALNICRTGHTATLLNNGKVLLVGSGADASIFNEVCGYGYPVPASATGSAEIYDPAMATFTPTAPPVYLYNWGHTATRLSDGRVLLTGGYVYGAFGSSGSNTAELYEPSSGTYTATGSMKWSRAFHTAVLLADGRVLVTGGAAAASSGEIYDPSSGQFSATGAPLAPDRVNGTATLLGSGEVLVVGGDSAAAGAGTAEIYDPMAGTYSATGALAEQYACSAYSPGGPPGGSVLNSCSAAALPDGNVLLVGGFTAEVYDVTTGTFAPTTSPMITGRIGAAATLLPNGMVLIAGGLSEAEYLVYSGGDLPTPVPKGVRISAFQTEIYDPLADSFSAGPVIFARFGLSATTLADGSVLLAGGGPLAAQIYQ